MEEWLLGLPAFMKVGISFIGILFLNSIGLALGLSILFFSIILSLWSGTGLAGLDFQFTSFALPENYLLPLVEALLLLFVEVLGKTGRIERTVQALQGMFKNKKTLFAGLPALIGMLPMPGGAIFSAPLVDSVDDNDELFSSEKAAVNYWFRHIWEYWWPMYPGVILAVKYSGLSFGFVAASFPIVFALIGNNPATGNLAAVTTLAYSSGYLGMMFSPLHVCFVVTCEYYSTRMTSVYRYIAGPSLLILITALLLAGFYFKLL